MGDPEGRISPNNTFMETMLRQVGEIAFTAIPTFLIVIFLWFYLRRMLFEPIDKVLSERRAASDGAKDAAKSALARAEQKVAEYEATLRTERGKVFLEIEAERKKWRDEQSAKVSAAREAVMAKVKTAKEQLASEAATAKGSLETEAGKLADQITATFLQGGAR